MATMLFCLMAEYSPSALKAMREDLKTDRQAAAAKIAEAAGGKLVAIYGISHNGPGVMTIVDVPDHDSAVAITGTAVESGAFTNGRLIRLFTMDEVKAIRQKRAKIAGAYKAPGQK
jgi:uncharacterized protein with GYD domain